MYWLADVAIILLVLLMAIFGWKKGFSNTAGGFFAVLIALALAGFGAFLLVTNPFEKWGWIETLTESFYNMLGGENTLFEKIGMTCEQVSKYLAQGVFGLGAFIVCYIISTLLMWLIRKFLNYCREFIAFKYLDSILGVVIDVAFAAVIIVGFMCVVRLCPGVFKITSETLQAAKISNIIYKLVGKILGAAGV